jgi:hypothetical protein
VRRVVTDVAHKVVGGPGDVHGVAAVPAVRPEQPDLALNHGLGDGTPESAGDGGFLCCDDALGLARGGDTR